MILQSFRRSLLLLSFLTIAMPGLASASWKIGCSVGVGPLTTGNATIEPFEQPVIENAATNFRATDRSGSFEYNASVVVMPSGVPFFSSAGISDLRNPSSSTSLFASIKAEEGLELRLGDQVMICRVRRAIPTR